MLDLESELKVADEFFRFATLTSLQAKRDFLRGARSYERLLETFEEIWQKMREEN